ncbi:MAG: T9SS type A sorting domain-containing protein [bacterium]|nr:T9SS type A sorting domain-containing protein [bacterium]
MRSTKIYLVLLLIVPCLVQAQYLGGNGRGDASITLTNVPLPVDENPYYSPAKFELTQNYPNPFNPNTVIGYQLSVISNVTLKVSDILGNEIATLVDEIKPAGTYEATFDASGLPSGVYLYRLQARNSSTSSGQSFVETRKMLLMK